ncbi:MULTISPECIES: Gfo/Idh/MocA family protein [unclassified Lentimonas]|nr:MULTISPECIES: Gfo/Idh/MocA family oxidoreductase [unclassified Lentimonas]
MNRRSFIKAAAGALALPTIVPSSVFGANAPSNRLRLGFIGVGNIGLSYHVPNFSKERGVEIVSICDVNQKTWGPALKKIADNKSNVPSKYVHYEEMFEQEDLDVVTVGLPDHWHVQCAMDALRQGLDVYCEKPLSRYQREGRILTDAVRRYQRVLQTGSQQRSMGSFQRAVELARNGYLGEVKRVWANVGMRMPRVCNLPAEPVPQGLDWDKWVGPADMTPYNERRFNGSYNHEKGWRGWIDYSISMFGDWGAHHFDIGQWGIGMERTGPVRILPQSKSPQNATTFIYENGVEMIQKPFSGAGDMQVTFEGTKGWAAASRGGFKCSKEVKNVVLSPTDERVGRGMNHQQDFLNCVKTRTRPIADVEIGHCSATVCHLAYISNYLERPLDWNPKAEVFANDTEATRMLMKAYREPYAL